MIPNPPSPTLFPYTTLFRSAELSSRGLVPSDLRDAPEAANDAGAVAPRPMLEVTSRRFKWLEALRRLRFGDRKSTRLNSSHMSISYAVFCLKKKKNKKETTS